VTCAGLNDQQARGIIRDLQEGFGVEDIAVRGTATKEQAEYVVNFMRQHGMLEKFYRNANRKRKKQCKSQ